MWHFLCWIIAYYNVMCLLTVKQAGTDATYTGIVIAGIAVTGITQCLFTGVLFACYLQYSYFWQECEVL